MTTIDAWRRPENRALTDSERRRVQRRVTTMRSTCQGCGGTEFEVGDALYLGFLFLDEESDAFMVALSCRNPRCPVPHTGVRLRRRHFLDDDTV
jgi:hypothetical protein